jgi:hypothetical protein
MGYTIKYNCFVDTHNRFRRQGFECGGIKKASVFGLRRHCHLGQFLLAEGGVLVGELETTDHRFEMLRLGGKFL